MINTAKNINKHIRNISNAIGYAFLDRVYPVFPQVLKEDFGVDINGNMERRFIVYASGKDDEIKIYGEGVLEGQEVCIIGELKTRPEKSDVRNFNKLLKRVKDHLGKKIIPLLLCYSLHPAVEEFIKEEYPEIKVYRSYELLGKLKG